MWDVTFSADTSLASAERGHVTATGKIALVQDHFGRSTFPQIAAPTHYGVYDVDFRVFGFEPRDEYVVPFAVAAVTPAMHRAFKGEAPDSLHIVLNPGESQIAIAMDGVISTDSAFGTWRVGSRSASGSGVFTMSPHQPLH